MHLNKEKQVLYLSNIFNSLPYALLETLVCDFVLYGAGLGGRFWTDVLLQYVLGVLIGVYLPLDPLSHALRRRLFPRVTGQRGVMHGYCFCYAIFFELAVGVTINPFYSYIMPGGTGTFREAAFLFAVTVPVSIPLNALISMAVLTPCEQLARRILHAELPAGKAV